jgi:hypothetical protein
MFAAVMMLRLGKNVNLKQNILCPTWRRNHNFLNKATKCSKTFHIND